MTNDELRTNLNQVVGQYLAFHVLSLTDSGVLTTDQDKYIYMKAFRDGFKIGMDGILEAQRLSKQALPM